MATQGAQTTPLGTQSGDEGQQGGQGGDAQALPDDTKQGGDQGGTGAPVGGDQNDNSGDGHSVDTLPKWAQGLIKDLREEAAGHRVKRKEDAEQARREALSEKEREIEDARNEERERLSSEFESQIIRTQAEAALASAKIVNPSKSIKLLDLDDLKINDEGEVEGLSDAVKQLKEDYPNLVESSSTNPNVGGGDGGNAPKGKTNMDDLLRAGFQARRGF